MIFQNSSKTEDCCVTNESHSQNAFREILDDAKLLVQHTSVVVVLGHFHATFTLMPDGSENSGVFDNFD